MQYLTEVSQGTQKTFFFDLKFSEHDFQSVHSLSSLHKDEISNIQKQVVSIYNLAE
jgi:hypothetical protein